jgi:hypothetical protein
MKSVFIQTNNKQRFGAKVAKFAIEKLLTDKEITVNIINVDELEVFRSFSNKIYLRDGSEVVYDTNDLQSFTLSRFMAPELMEFRGRAVVIDPDVFALKDISLLFKLDMCGKSIATCRKKDGWDTSVMVLECSLLRHWTIESILSCLDQREIDYSELMTLKNENERSILELPRIWNNLDTLTAETRFLHTTQRLTQPWKTGLKIDFTRKPLRRLFGFIPREWVLRLLGRYPSRYQTHPNKAIEKFFLTLCKQALASGIVRKEELLKEIQEKNVRQDLIELLK